MKYKSCFLLLLSAMVLIGCSYAPERSEPQIIEPPAARAEGHVTDLALKQLYAQYVQWKGVRYKIGGLSNKGVDCSGFVYITFRERFGIELPRSTRQQATLGTPVDKGQLRAGDLVFFKTSLFDRHVGIYLERGSFLHAATSRGVMISHLDDRYWRSRFWKAIRIGI